MKKEYKNLKSEVVLYPGMGGWHFLFVPKKESAEIKQNFGARARGWRSLRVRVSLGATKWNTSIFPDTRAGAYLLPLKAEVRKKEGVFAGERVSFSILLQV